MYIHCIYLLLKMHCTGMHEDSDIIYRDCIHVQQSLCEEWRLMESLYTIDLYTIDIVHGTVVDFTT